MDKLSVITVCLNSAKTIGATIESVLQQTYSEIEYIIVDGLSTDGTLDLIDQHKKEIDLIISEEDAGIYDAMNKGVKLAKGDFVFFLNSDDVFHDSTVVADVMERIEKDRAISLMFGNVIYQSSSGAFFRSYRHLTRNNIIYENLCHQCVFARRALFNEFGLFDVAYRINADYDWLLSIFFSGTAIVYYDRTIAVFNAEGEHSNNIESHRQERMDVKLRFQSAVRYKAGELIHRLKRKFVSDGNKGFEDQEIRYL